jgi:hypothetical protein
MSPREPKCTSFQSIEEVMLFLNRRANARWLGQQEHGSPDSSEAKVPEGRVTNLVSIDSRYTKRCPGADGPAFNPKCLYWIRPEEARCWSCQARIAQPNLNERPHIRMFTSSRRICTLKSNCGGLMEAYLKSTWPGGQAVANRELWWKCMRCGGTKQAGVAQARTQADMEYKCDGKSPRITCDCAKCSFYFQDQTNATNACSAFLSEAQEQAAHIKDILKDQELK